MKKSLLAAACFLAAAGAAGSDTGGTGTGAASAPPPTPEPTPAPAEKQVKVRVLTDCEHGKANDLAVLPVTIARQAVASGLADDDKAAVTYAAGLAQNQPKLKKDDAL